MAIVRGNVISVATRGAFLDDAGLGSQELVAVSISPSTGPTAGGITAVIALANGSVGIDTVTVNGNAATVQSVSSTSASITIPAGSAGTGNVVVTPTSGSPSTLTNAWTYIGSEDIHSLITANLKTALLAISTGAGYTFTPGAVEEWRSIYKAQGNFPYVLLLEQPVEYREDYQHTNDVIYGYTILYIDNSNDDDTDNDPFAYQNRRIVADITRAVMSDRTRGALAQNTVVEWSGPILYEDYEGSPIPCTAIEVQVEALVNADNPYQIAG